MAVPLSPILALGGECTLLPGAVYWGWGGAAFEATAEEEDGKSTVVIFLPT